MVDDVNKRLDVLTGDYLDGEIDSAGVRELARRLRIDGHAVDRFVATCRLHWQLFDLARQNAVRADALQDSEVSQSNHRVSVDLAAVGNGIHAAPSSRRGGPYLALAFGLAALATVVVWSLWRAPVVAQLSDVSTDAAWDGDSLGAGSLMRRGENVSLARGRCSVTLTSGARVIIQAPAAMTLSGENEIRLTSGRLTAIVPRQAAGFRIETAVGHFVDLGTEFMLRLADSDQCQLQVFKGLVEFQPVDDRGGPLRVPGGRAIGYDASDRKITVLDYDPEQRMLPPD